MWSLHVHYLWHKRCCTSPKTLVQIRAVGMKEERKKVLKNKDSLHFWGCNCPHLWRLSQFMQTISVYRPAHLLIHFALPLAMCKIASGTLNHTVDSTYSSLDVLFAHAVTSIYYWKFLYQVQNIGEKKICDIESFDVIKDIFLGYGNSLTFFSHPFPITRCC